MIDLYSDTRTMPTPGMSPAIAEAHDCELTSFFPRLP